MKRFIYQYYGKQFWRKWPVERLTKTQIVARCNEVAVLKFRKPDNLESGNRVETVPRERFSQMSYIYVEEKG